MIGIYVSVPIACFRKGLAREYLETEKIPPPSTCYGFLLSLVGETDRERHLGARVMPVLLSKPEESTVLRTVWRVKKKRIDSSENRRPDIQQLLANIRLILWLDSSDEEHDAPRLEDRVRIALDPERRGEITRFGGLSFGESTHLVDEVSLYDPDSADSKSILQKDDGFPLRMCQNPAGLHTWTVWVDHVGAKDTRYVVGELVSGGLEPPDCDEMPLIHKE